MIPMTIYLDTSILRGLPVGAIPNAELECFSSALAAFELLERLAESEDEFLARRRALRSFAGGPFSVDWTLHDFAAAGAFRSIRGLLPDPDPRIEIVRRCVEAAALSETTEDYEARIAKAGLAEGLSSLIAAFRRHTEEPRRLSVDVRATVLEFAGAAPDIDDSKGARASRRKVREDLAAASITDIGRAFSCRVLAKTISVNLGLSMEDGDIDALVESYDGSLDPYLSALTLTSTAWPLDGSGPSDNSVLDVEHLAYVRPGVVLATRDHKMRDIALRSGARLIDFDSAWSRSVRS